MEVPKSGFWARAHSPLAARLTKSHCGRKSPFRSFHTRVVLVRVPRAGLARAAHVDRFGPSRYLPRPALTAVLPLPKRSYAPPRRGEIFFQLATSGIASNVRLRLGTSGPGVSSFTGTSMF